jgi:hypothetical protein
MHKVTFARLPLAWSINFQIISAPRPYRLVAISKATSTTIMTEGSKISIYNKHLRLCPFVIPVGRPGAVSTRIFLSFRASFEGCPISVKHTENLLRLRSQWSFDSSWVGLEKKLSRFEQLNVENRYRSWIGHLTYCITLLLNHEKPDVCPRWFHPKCCFLQNAMPLICACVCADCVMPLLSPGGDPLHSPSYRTLLTWQPWSQGPQQQNWVQETILPPDQ